MLQIAPSSAPALPHGAPRACPASSHRPGPLPRPEPPLLPAPGSQQPPDPSLYGPVDPGAAEDFLRLYYAECPHAGPLEPRLKQVLGTIDRIGTYLHNPGELEFGARVAWRNNSRCIGRLYWNSLRVLDRRGARSPDEIGQHLVTHLRESTNSGRIRPTISIFAPAMPDRPYSRVWNEQLIRYAGYRSDDGAVIGDPRYVEFTAAVQGLGWISKGTPFDILPLVIDVPGEPPYLHELPEDAILEVPLRHPAYGWFAELDLRWHAVPAISNMRLEIGGVNYPFAPFNGWYMGTEIGSRNLADTDRYDLVPEVARRIGLDTSSETTLWRDRALVELNLAVLHSFECANVKIADHHTESHRFLTHVDKENRAGRIAPADWTWIVPPLSGSATAVFHKYYDEADLSPNFHLDDHAATLGRCGRAT